MNDSSLTLYQENLWKPTKLLLSPDSRPPKRAGFFASIRKDLDSVLERDPAARSRLEVFLVYSGLHAIWAHRITHWLWMHNFKFLWALALAGGPQPDRG